jgi:Lrp/AsnC family transcriptional regulator for asnA, asnC and gidA
MAISKLDAIDYGIIRQLQDDGRRAFREIVRNLRIPEATVRTWVKRLRDQVVVQVLAFTDPFMLGNSKMALFLVDAEPDQRQRIVKSLEALPEVSYLSTTTGPADLCVRAMRRRRRPVGPAAAGSWPARRHRGAPDAGGQGAQDPLPGAAVRRCRMIAPAGPRGPHSATMGSGLPTVPRGTA